VEGEQDYELDKVKIKKSEEINERKRLAKRARNNKVNTSQMGKTSIGQNGNSRNGS